MSLYEISPHREPRAPTPISLGDGLRLDLHVGYRTRGTIALLNTRGGRVGFDYIENLASAGISRNVYENTPLKFADGSRIESVKRAIKAGRKSGRKVYAAETIAELVRFLINQHLPENNLLEDTTDSED